MKIFALAATLLLTTGLAAAQKSSATDAIRNANSRVRELLSTKGDTDKIAPRVTTELRGLFDIGDLARRALVDHWDKMTAAQRNELVETLRLIVERNYISQLRTNLTYEIAYTGEDASGDDKIVKTVIKAQRSGRPIEIPVDYVLHAEGGGWKAYDVVTDGVSLLKNYRSQFNRIISREGYDGLIKRMKSRLERDED
jgi:phospholipid transport system substrate-binding protein